MGGLYLNISHIHCTCASVIGKLSAFVMRTYKYITQRIIPISFRKQRHVVVIKKRFFAVVFYTTRVCFSYLSPAKLVDAEKYIYIYSKRVVIFSV